MKIALVVMPFAAITRPSLSVGLLQASLQRASIDCESVYLNLLLGEMLGASAYRRFSSDAAITALAGEWAFSQLLFGRRLSDWEWYRHDVLDHPVWGTSRERHAEILALLEIAPAFLDRAFAARDWAGYDLVGFTSTFEQTMPSLCLARMVREHHPSTLLAIGGANFEAEMGRPYLDEFEFLDFVSTAEADVSFPRLCASLRDWKAGRTPGIEVPGGILFRDRGTMSPRTTAAAPRPNLEHSPTPNYDDFFRAVRRDRSPVSDPEKQWLPIEASRGCWWGEKVHCTFCGLNGETMRFRAKSAQRVIEESDELAGRYGVGRLQFADNILDMAYFDDLLPFWAERRDRTERFFEIKSNLSRDQLALLRRAGVTTVQAGIESLSDHTLRVMGKGVSAAQNVALLRWCSELGIDPLWNVIYAFPQERLADYPAMLAVLRHLVHLPPPDAAAPIRMDRFSPNFMQWRERGFTRIAAMPAYRHVFPFDQEQLASAAYYFQYDHPQLAEALGVGAALERFVWEWQQKHQAGRAGALALERREDGIVLNDTRYTSEAAVWELDPIETAVMVACDRPVSRSAAIARATSARHGDADAVQLDSALRRLEERGAVVQIGNLLITLACIPADVRASIAGGVLSTAAVVSS